MGGRSRKTDARTLCFEKHQKQYHVASYEDADTVFSGGCDDGVVVREGLEAGEKTRS